MAFQVSCGGCHVRGLGYIISLTTVWVGLNGGFTCYTVVNIVLPVKGGGLSVLVIIYCLRL